MKIILLTSFISLLFSVISCSVNFYLDQNEVKRIFGLPAELFYVRNGYFNEYALKYLVPISTEIDTLYFTWQSLTGRNLPYSINFEMSDNLILDKIQLNISTVGQVPTSPETFSVQLPCTGQYIGDVNITMNVNITFNRVTNNITSIHIIRQKFCSKLSNQYSTLHNNQVSIDIAPNETLSTNIFYMANACAIAVILVTTIFICAYYMQNKKTHQDETENIRQNRQPRCGGVSTSPPVPQHPSSVVPSVCYNGSTVQNFDNASYQSIRRHIHRLSEDEAKDLQQKIVELSVQRSQIRLNNAVLEGTFGRIYHGVLHNKDEVGTDEMASNVIIKTVTDHASKTQISLLLQEGLSMYGLEQENVLSVIGVSMGGGVAPCLVYPYDGFTNLKRFLQKCKLCTEGVARTITTQEVIEMVLQVVQGMQYLHSKMLKHKDLAARNCVVDDKLQIKITDNALARDLFPADYHCLGDNENRPIKWLAIESLQYNLFLFQSDVWSFGVLLWEFMTLAQQPYVEIDPFEMEAYLKDGYRLAQPVNCPDELFAVMAYCWAMRTEERPSFKQLQLCLQDFYMQLTKYV